MTDDSKAVLDEVDRRLLEVLQLDGRATLVDLGRRVGLSPAAVADRMRRLQLAGVITGYTAQVDAGRVGLGLTAFIRVASSGQAPAGLLEELAGRPEVLEAHHVVGDDCWIFKVAVPDTNRLESLLQSLARLGRTTTSIVLSTRVRSRPLLPPE